jgi:Protein of unknown function (DUF1579)
MRSCRWSIALIVAGSIGSPSVVRGQERKDQNRIEKFRTVTTIVDNDHFTLEWFRINDAGKEEKVVSMAHTRKKA